VSGSHRGRPGAWWGAGRAPGGRASGRRPGGGRAPSGLVGRRSGAEWVDPGLLDDTERTWLRQTTQAGNPAAKFAGPRSSAGVRRRIRGPHPWRSLWCRLAVCLRPKRPGRLPGTPFGPFGPSWVPKSVVQQRISVPKTAPHRVLALTHTPVRPVAPPRTPGAGGGAGRAGRGAGGAPVGLVGAPVGRRVGGPWPCGRHRANLAAPNHPGGESRSQVRRAPVPARGSGGGSAGRCVGAASGRAVRTLGDPLASCWLCAQGETPRTAARQPLRTLRPVLGTEIRCRASDFGTQNGTPRAGEAKTPVGPTTATPHSYGATPRRHAPHMPPRGPPPRPPRATPPPETPPRRPTAGPGGTPGVPGVRGGGGAGPVTPVTKIT